MSLPIGKESIQYNGNYIENLIDGYKTYKVDGRASNSNDIETESIINVDGKILKSNQFVARTLTVTWMIVGDSQADLWKKLNKLNGLFNKEEAEWIVADESDKFWTGVAYMDEEPARQENLAKGTFKIFCAFPFKQSTTLYEITPVISGDTATATIAYSGTYLSKPILQAEFDSSCGYVAFMDDDENIIQLGNPDAVDADAATVDELFNDILSSKGKWSYSGGETYTSATIDGSMTFKATPTYVYANPSYGSASSGWHGPQLYRALTGIETGDYNFKIEIVHRFCIGKNKTGQLGIFECGAFDSDGHMIAGFRIRKSTTGTRGAVDYIVNHKVVGKSSIDLSYTNKDFGYNDNGNFNSMIKKVGSSVKISVGDLTDFTYKDSDITSIAPVSMVMSFLKKGTTDAVNTMAVRRCIFTNLKSTQTFAEIKNVFVAGNIVEADCSDASVTRRASETKRGRNAPQYGALGNDWESFGLKNGVNIIAISWSDWVSTAPTLAIKYREVFI